MVEVSETVVESFKGMLSRLEETLQSDKSNELEILIQRRLLRSVIETIKCLK